MDKDCIAGAAKQANATKAAVEEARPRQEKMQECGARKMTAYRGRRPGKIIVAHRTQFAIEASR